MKTNIGVIYAISAYLLWGVFPIFWKQLEHISSQEIIAHRIIWGGVILSLFIILSRQWAQFKNIFSMPQTLAILLAASLAISLNWGVFIWAVNHNHILDVSLGYFINPLINVLFGILFFKERFKLNQKIALFIALFGVLILMVDTGGIPVVSLSLALSFSIYGALKKKLSIPVSHGLTVEILIVTLPALLFLLYSQQHLGGNFLGNPKDSMYLILGGFVTLIPLLFFAAAAKHTSMSTLGMMQYLAPSCHLLIAVIIYHEPFETGTRFAFIFIWLALLIYTFNVKFAFSRWQLPSKK